MRFGRALMAVFVALFFAAIAFGAFKERRAAALPLGIIFACVSLSCVVTAVKQLRGPRFE